MTLIASISGIQGDADAEYDFRNFRRDINLERSQRTGVPPSNIGPDSLLNQGAATAIPSLVNSPTLGVMAAISQSGGATNNAAAFPDAVTSDIPFADFDANFVNTLFGFGNDGGFSGPSEALDSQQDDPLAWLWTMNSPPGH